MLSWPTWVMRVSKFGAHLAGWLSVCFPLATLPKRVACATDPNAGVFFWVLLCWVGLR